MRCGLSTGLTRAYSIKGHCTGTPLEGILLIGCCALRLVSCLVSVL